MKCQTSLLIILIALVIPLIYNYKYSLNVTGSIFLKGFILYEKHFGDINSSYSPELRTSNKILNLVMPSAKDDNFNMNVSADVFKILCGIVGYHEHPVQEIKINGNFTALFLKNDKPSGFALLSFHGGGYELGHPVMEEYRSLMFMKRFGLDALAPDYRMVPNYPMESILEDAVASYKYLLKSYKSDHIIVTGTSAGGHLTFALMQKIKELKLGAPMALVVFSPANFELMLSKPFNEWNSYKNNDPMLSREGWIKFTDFVFKQHKNKEFFKEYAKLDFKGFSSTFIVGAENETILDGVEFYINKLKQVGANIQFKVVPNVYHGYPALYENSPEGTSTFEDVEKFLSNIMKKI